MATSSVPTTVSLRLALSVLAIGLAVSACGSSSSTRQSTEDPITSEGSSGGVDQTTEEGPFIDENFNFDLAIDAEILSVDGDVVTVQVQLEYSNPKYAIGQAGSTARMYVETSGGVEFIAEDKCFLFERERFESNQWCELGSIVSAESTGENRPDPVEVRFRVGANSTDPKVVLQLPPVLIGSDPDESNNRITLNL